jgi:hypothetical protein
VAGDARQRASRLDLVEVDVPGQLADTRLEVLDLRLRATTGNRYEWAMPSPRCWQCKAPLDLVAGRPIGRTESCPECDADLRVCRGCASFSSSGTCDEPTAEQPADRERANFCGAFRLAAHEPKAEVGHTTTPVEDARSRLEALFRK